MKKKLPLPRLKKKLWRVFSEFIRRRDSDPNGNVRCISCSTTRHWKEVHAGHYEKSTYLGTCFDERNVHGQCPHCNFHLDGNQSAYAIALRKKYGETILEDLDSAKRSRDKYTREEYDDLIQRYKQKLKDLDGFTYGARG